MATTNLTDAGKALLGIELGGVAGLLAAVRVGGYSGTEHR